MAPSATAPPISEMLSKTPITRSGDPALSILESTSTGPPIFEDKFEERRYLKHGLAIAF